MDTKNKTVAGQGIAPDARYMLSVNDAMTAIEYADTVVSGCESIDELDSASDFDIAFANAPDSFTSEQKHLAQQVILRAFEKSIGRA